MRGDNPVPFRQDTLGKELTQLSGAKPALLAARFQVRLRKLHDSCLRQGNSPGYALTRSENACNPTSLSVRSSRRIKKTVRCKYNVFGPHRDIVFYILGTNSCSAYGNKSSEPGRLAPPGLHSSSRGCPARTRILKVHNPLSWTRMNPAGWLTGRCGFDNSSGSIMIIE